VEALEQSARGSLAEAEDEALANAIRNGQVPGRYYTGSFHADHFGAPFRTQLEDPLNILRYFSESCYSQHVVRWEQRFPGLVHVVTFERLVAQPHDALSEIYEFCGLDPSKGSKNLPRENPTRVVRGPVARWFVSRAINRKPGGLLDQVVRTAGALRVRTLVRSRMLERRRPDLSPDTRARCRSLLADEYAWWAERHSSIVDWWS
jgi:hypothetical protein